MNKPYKIIVWGPGEVGGAVVRAIHARDEFELVGVKVFSPHKDGKDIGELVGIGPIGVMATTSKEAIMNLNADCVIMTSKLLSVFQRELDNDVIEFLELGSV
jgi:hypothetical protein